MPRTNLTKALPPKSRPIRRSPEPAGRSRCYQIRPPDTVGIKRTAPTQMPSGNRRVLGIAAARLQASGTGSSDRSVQHSAHKAAGPHRDAFRWSNCHLFGPVQFTGPHHAASSSWTFGPKFRFCSHFYSGWSCPGLTSKDRLELTV